MNTEKEYQICLGGVGGQGVMLSAKIIGLALADDGYNVLVTQSHGIEARGGASFGEVIYSLKQINRLKVDVPDFLLALSQSALGGNCDRVAEGGYIFYDSYMIKDEYTNPKYKVYACPFTELSYTNFDSALSANIIALGFINGITKIMSKENLEAAVVASLKANAENGKKALEIGYAEAAKLG